jgi:hypothetical protein
LENFLLNHVPGFLLALLFLAVSTGLAVAGLFVVRRNIALSTLESHNDVAGFIIAVIGVLYSVMLAFVVVILWEQYDSASRNADHEASLVLSLYRNAGAFPADAPRLRADIRRYAESVADDEWKTMASRQDESKATDAAFNRLWVSLDAVRPGNAAETTYFSESVKQLNEAQQARRERIFGAAAELPIPLWFVLVAGAMVTIGFTYFFGVANFRANVLMVVALSSITGLILFLVMSLDLPFAGAVAVKPTAMRETIHEFAHVGQ